SAILSERAGVSLGAGDPAAPPGCVAAYSPLPTPQGELIQDPDFTLPTSAGPLPWQLFYHSAQAQVSNPFGFGRRASSPLRLAAQVSGNVTTVTVDREVGTTVRYVQTSPANPFTPVSQRTFDTLVKNADGSWDETRFDTGTLFHYPAGSVTTLAYFQTVYSRRVTMNYDTSGRLASIQEPLGRRITYHYTAGGNVDSLTDWAQRVNTLTYDGSGNLTQVEGPTGCITQYGYGANHLLTSITDPEGFQTTYTYDVAARVLTRSVAGNLGRYTYVTQSG